MSVFSDLSNSPAEEGLFDSLKKKPSKNDNSSQEKELVSKISSSDKVSAMRAACLKIAKSPKFKKIADAIKSDRGGYLVNGDISVRLVGWDIDDIYEGDDDDVIDRLCEIWDDFAEACTDVLEKMLKQKKLPGSIDEDRTDGGMGACLMWTDIPASYVRDLKGETPAEESFFTNLSRSFKKKFATTPGKTLKNIEMNEDIRHAYVVAFEESGRKHVNAMQAIFKKMIRDQKYKIAANGFDVAEHDADFETGCLYYYTGGGTFEVSIISWDLWDIYPDARTRYGDGNVEEFNTLYDDLVTAFKDYLKKNNLPGTFDDSGDWDGGWITWCIPAAEIKKVTPNVKL